MYRYKWEKISKFNKMEGYEHKWRCKSMYTFVVLQVSQSIEVINVEYNDFFQYFENRTGDKVLIAKTSNQVNCIGRILRNSRPGIHELLLIFQDDDFNSVIKLQTNSF